MRLYSNIAQDTVLTADPGVSGATINVVSTSGWPSPSSGDTALACLDYGAGNVELIEYTGLTGTSLTGCVRAVDGTTATAHNVGAVVKHVASASDIQSFMRYGDFHTASWQSGQWYSPPGIVSVGTTALASGTIKEIQVPLPARTRFLGIGTEVTTAGAGNLRFAIYRDNGSGKPSTLVLDCGSVSASTTGFKSITIDVYLVRGLYHLGCMAETATITVRAAATHTPPARLPISGQNIASIYTGYQATGVTTGAAPSPFPVGMSLTNTMPVVALLTA